MAMLHVVNKSPFERNSLDACLRLAEEGSSVLLIEDGIYAAMKDTVVSDKVIAKKGLKFYVLGPDLKARGMSEDRLIDGIDVVDYGGFVDLTAEHDVVQSWL
ncbi:MAG TPA: sulfurtransferase complex subunit TusB [Gammaproteobacteria bacterium]|nr:sulfurtransferase complex subunit TusB [Gammaproteobacteria bacterium]